MELSGHSDLHSTEDTIGSRTSNRLSDKHLSPLRPGYVQKTSVSEEQGKRVTGIRRFRQRKTSKVIYRSKKSDKRFIFFLLPRFFQIFYLPL